MNHQHPLNERLFPYFEEFSSVQFNTDLSDCRNIPTLLEINQYLINERSDKIVEYFYILHLTLAPYLLPMEEIARLNHLQFTNRRNIPTF